MRSATGGGDRRASHVALPSGAARRGHVARRRRSAVLAAVAAGGAGSARRAASSTHSVLRAAPRRALVCRQTRSRVPPARVRPL